jgi:hypothetical protein
MTQGWVHEGTVEDFNEQLDELEKGITRRPWDTPPPPDELLSHEDALKQIVDSPLVWEVELPVLMTYRAIIGGARTEAEAYQVAQHFVERNMEDQARDLTENICCGQVENVEVFIAEGE